MNETRINAGDLRDVVTIEHQPAGSTETNRLGHRVGEWATFARRRANVVQTAAAESVAQAAKQTRATYTVTLRTVTGVTERMRLVWGSKTLNITAVVTDLASTVLTCVEAL